MPFPITVTYTFGPMSGLVPASDLDTNFSQLFNAVNGINNGSYPLTGVSVTGGTWAGSPIAVTYGGTGLSATPTNGQIPIGNGTGYSLSTLTAGTGINITNGAGTVTISAPETGTVTSVDVSGGTTGMNFTGGPVTSSGTMIMSGTLAVANGGTGVTTSTGSGSVVLSTSPTLVTPNLGTPSAATLTNATGLPLTTGVTGTLPIANGGTNATTASAARTSLGAAASGANTDITSIALTTGTISTTPSTTTSIANKNYVDSAVGGLTSQVACNYATTADLGTLTYSNGTAGVGATLTKTSPFAVFSVDGASPAVGSRILVKNQTTQTQNGVYTVTSVGSGSAGWVLTRATDYDQSAEISAGDGFYVISGSTLGNTTWVQQTAAPVTIGTNNITFIQFAASTAGIKQPYAANGAVYATSTSALTTGTLPISGGGTGLTTTPSNGQIDIGNGTGFTRTTLTAGSNVTITNGPGTITIAASGGGSSAITINTTTITGGTSGRVLYDNAGTVGELATTGSGSVVLATSPTLTTPNLGTPSAATLTNATGLPLTTGVTGTLAIANGGTGATTASTALSNLGGCSTGKAIAMSVVFGG